jgi:death on curing protein
VYYLTHEQIILLHEQVIKETGGLDGVRDSGAILSVAQLPQQTIFGNEAYSTIFLKSAVYARNIITGHPFLDGNKRTGMVVASVFLESNGYNITAVEGSVEEFALRIIEQKLSLNDIAQWFQDNTSMI